YTVGKIITVKLTPQPVADHRTLTVRREGSHQAALQIESLRLSPISALRQALEGGIGGFTKRRAVNRGSEQGVCLGPALPDRRGRKPQAFSDACLVQHLRDGNLPDIQVPLRGIAVLIGGQQRAPALRSVPYRERRILGLGGSCGSRVGHEVDIVEVVWMKGCDWIGMPHDVVLGAER